MISLRPLFLVPAGSGSTVINRVTGPLQIDSDVRNVTVDAIIEEVDSVDVQIESRDIDSSIVKIADDVSVEKEVIDAEA